MTIESHVDTDSCSPTTTVSTAIVSYNTIDLLRNCLSSFPHEPGITVTVIDNGSSDGSIEMVRAEFPQVQLIVSTRNAGYGAAANLALRQTQADYLFLLNSDTTLHAGIVRSLADYLDQHPEVAVVGPRLLNVDGSHQSSTYSWPTPLHLILQESGLIRAVANIPLMRNYFPRTWRHDVARSVAWLLGAALMLRIDAMRSVGGFDERYFMYYEEVDLCLRLSACGWERRFVPELTLVHVGGASTQHYASAMALEWRRGLGRLYADHFSRFQLVTMQLVMVAIIALRLMRETIRLLMVTGNSRTQSLNRLRMWCAMIRTCP